MADHPKTDLVPYLRGELAPADRARVARHLEDCPELVAIEVYITSAHRAYRIADHYRSKGVHVALGGLHVTALPAIHWGRWRAELTARRDARRGRHAWWWRPVPLALSASLAGALLVLVVLGGPGTPTGNDLAVVEQTLLGRRLELLRQLSVVERLELLEDLDIIRQLDRLAAASEG